MALNVNNKQADELTRKFAQLEGVGLSEAIVIAMREAIARRRASETPRQTVERVLSKHGISNNAKIGQPLPRSAYDEMWGDEDKQ
ncbi:putative transcription factor [Devosia sp. LC5]|uniref:type II toxin-antitoxin system VapB family antitoxin n=1 Tax=Devosia sp. LC5 TaxID=1502724 RepID=UPI0004E3C1C4|nr:type II toxin-antitoxin system VapB family antitoxin [Devosia sp. LC5]KFC66390.1 putative transcription factor [Devosia sp. LC5]